MSDTILVTGAAGFIGSHLTEALLGRGADVIGLDNLNDYYSPARKRANLGEVARHPAAARFRFVAGDIRDQALLGRLFADHAIDAVVHLAALAGVRASLAMPREYLDVNLCGTVGLLEEASRARLRCFVLASSSSVYGADARVPFVETDRCDRPLAPYPATKRAAEMLGYGYHQQYGLDVTALRFFTVYGPRGRPDMLPMKLLDGVFAGEAVPLYGGGTMRRDWTFVGDIVTGILAAVDRPLGYEIVNLGRGSPLCVRDFVAALERRVGRPVALSDEPAPATDMECTHADLTKARALLGYSPAVAVDEGIDAMCSWYEREVRAVR